MLTAYRSAAAALAALTLITGVVGPGRPARAGQDAAVLGADTVSAVPGHYMVVLRNGKDVPAQAQALADQYRGSLGAVFQRSIAGFAMALDETAAKRLAGDARVAYVEQEQLLHIADTQEFPATPGLDRIDQRTLPLDTAYTYDNFTSPVVTAYIVDTGIRVTHTDFGGRASDAWDFVNNDSVADDCNGHGTHVAGIVGGTAYGVAKSVRLKAVKAFGCNGVATTSSLQSAIEWITVNAVKPAVANLSLAYECKDASGNPTQCSAGAGQTIKTAMSNAIAAGIPFVLASGNQNIDACQSPFNTVATAIRVGASNVADGKLNISNWGSCVDIWAPGDSIRSDYNTSDTTTAVDSGTSMAAPHVAGALALMLARPGFATKTPTQLKAQLLTESTPNVLTGLNAGSPNNLLYTSPPPVAGGSPIALARNADGRLTLFGVTMSGSLLVRTQTAADSTSWTPWATSVDPNWYSVCSDTDNDSRIRLAGLRRTYETWNRMQAAANSGSWSVWQKLDGAMNSCALTTENTTLYMFATNAQGGLFQRSQASPGGGSFGAWVPVSSGVPALRSIAAERNSTGFLQMIGLDRTGGVWHCWTIGTNCAPAGWSHLDGLLKSVALARQASGTLTMYGVNAAGQMFSRDSGPGVNVWSAWVPMTFTGGTPRSVAAETNADGRIQLVATTTNSQVWVRTQTAPNSATYSAWTQLDGLLRP